jgi:hypothetical protein
MKCKLKALVVVGVNLVCGLAVSCSSVQYVEDVAQAADSASVEKLQEHMGALTALGPRRAGDAEVGQLTVAYLEQQLWGMGIETERESFELTPGAKLVVLLKEGGPSVDGAVESWEVPGVFFGRNISQARVVEGFVRKAGLFDKFAGYGIEYGESGPVEQVNVIATIPGTVSPEWVLEISAHHDTVPGTVGADDNTSSVAVLLEVARLLRENPPACSVRLCFFAAEEIGLIGSGEHVRLMQEQGTIEEVFALINMDGVGHFTDEPDSQGSPIRIPFVVWPPKTGNFLGIIGANGSGWLGDLVVDAGALYVADLPTYSLARLGGFFPDARRSDHAHYWDLDIPAVFLTDTNDFRTDNYHRPSDDLSSINMDALRNVAALVYASAMSAAANEASP